MGHSNGSTAPGMEGLPFFLQLPSPVMKDFLELCSTSRLEPGALIFEAGRPVDALHVVSNGTVELLFPKLRGAAELVEAGSCFGEAAFLSGGPSATTARARSRAEVMTLDRTRLAEWVRRQPQVSRYLESMIPKPAEPPRAVSPSEPGLEELFGDRPSAPSSPPPELFGDEAPRKNEPPPDF